MVRQTAAALIAANFTRQTLRDAAIGCRARDLWQKGTQTVFGEGVENARVMSAGEQPGNEEDLAAPLLQAELEVFRPLVLECLGATATVHPSSILRAPDSETRQSETARLIDDLRPLAQALQLKTRKAR